MSKKSETEILVPTPVVVRLGDREYSVRPMNLKRMRDFTRVIGDIAAAASSSPALTSVMNMDTDNLGQVVGAISGLVMEVPEHIPALLGVIVEHPEDAEYFEEEARPAQVIKALTVFLEQNDPKELIENFFALRDLIQANIPKKETTA